MLIFVILKNSYISFLNYIISLDKIILFKTDNMLLTCIHIMQSI